MYDFFQKLWRFDQVKFAQRLDLESSFATYLFGRWPFLSFLILLKGVSSVYYVVSPLFLSKMIESKSWGLLWIYLGLGLLAKLLFMFSEYLELRWVSRQQYAIRVWAQRQLLETDPVVHSTLSHGKTFSKLNPLTTGIYELVSNITGTTANVVITLVTVVILFAGFDPVLSVVLSVVLLLQMSLAAYLKFKISKTFKPIDIKARDAATEASTVLVTQKDYIRTVFATKQLFTTYTQKFIQALVVIRTSAMTHKLLNSLVQILTLILTGVVVGWLFWSDLSDLTILALLAALARGEQVVNFFSNIVLFLTTSWVDVSDAWEFIRKNTQKSFPVMEDETTTSRPVGKTPVVAGSLLRLQKVSLAYESEDWVLKDHDLELDIPLDVSSKLVGVVGPSGTGKTTLVSILGGQLKPDQGRVLVGGFDIYELDDAGRRGLLAMQMQTSTSLRGKLSQNLVFGLPSDVYTQDEVIQTLQQVGLWHLFADRKGLDTLIGEGGLNLSGGQRQRLNFASLYLRAKYYNPLLILIDEPTSSLDEVSEKAITEMIHELSQEAVTLVVAHRLVTLDKAWRLIDSSLFEKDQQIGLYTHKELQQVSEYYRRLLSGELELGK